MTKHHDKPPALHLYPDELIIDSFAGGGGASLGIEMALGRSPDIAVNHDPEAIAMHQANHPDTKHFCESVWDVSPKKVTGGKPVGLAWFSPDCKHFSKAKGGKPVDKAVRGLAWVAIRWARDVSPRVIILENVEEFQTWGPLLEDGTPCPARKGFTFRRWVAELRGCGYVVEHRELRACDYGTPTTRKRLFVIARNDGQPIVWPEPTHGPGRREPYRTAAECIDWSLECPSIFDRTKPLADNTLRRIARGIQRYVIDAAEPFIVPLTHQGERRAHPLSEPLPTVTGAHRGEHALVSPTIVRIGHTGHGDAGKTNSIDAPLSTITSKAEHLLVAPSLIQTGYGERAGQAPRCLDIHQPLGTVVAGGAKHALVAAFLAKHYGGHEATGKQLSLPIDTVTSVDHHSLVACHLQRDFGKSIGSSLAEPALATTAGGGGHQAIVASHLMKLRGSVDTHPSTSQDLRSPTPTLTAGGLHLAEVRAFLIKYYGTEQDPRLQLPLDTVTTKDRFGLVRVHGEDYAIADIGMRMLAPRELFRAQGFPDTYRIDIEFNGKPLSKTAQVRMCGNSVCPELGAALVYANVGQVAATAGTREWFPPAHVKASAQLSFWEAV
jgi:DNA (cytosine-5)-methyltransferase 1